MSFLVRLAAQADIPAIARVHLDTWRTAYAQILDPEYLAGLSYEVFEQRRRDHLMATRQCTQLALSDGVVCGFAIAGPNRGIAGSPHDGEISAIYVRESAARQGAGSRLMGACAAWLAARGALSLCVWVLTDNGPARRFYEKLGGVPCGMAQVTIGAQVLEEVGYGWPDLAVLTSLS